MQLNHVTIYQWTIYVYSQKDPVPWNDFKGTRMFIHKAVVAEWLRR